jgi:AraC-like DNA-binding protein
MRYDFMRMLPSEFEIINISDIYRDHKDKLTSPHRINLYLILWIQKGSPKHIVDFNSISINPGSILFVTKDCVNIFDDADYNGKLIMFSDSFFCKNQPDSYSLQSSILFNDLYGARLVEIIETEKEITRVFEAMEAEYFNPTDDVHQDILRNYLHNFLLLCTREKRRQGTHDIEVHLSANKLLLFRELLEKKYKSIKLVNEYAETLNISAKKLTKSTKSILGKTPKQLINDRVILEAKRLLVYSNLSIKEIAFDLGFAEPTNFSKYFAKHTENSPIEFRKKFDKQIF